MKKSSLSVLPMAFKTRHSVEHCTLHADGAWIHFTGLSIVFRMIKLYLLPIYWQSMEEVAFHFNLQKPISLNWYECKTNFEFVMLKNLPIPF